MVSNSRMKFQISSYCFVNIEFYNLKLKIRSIFDQILFHNSYCDLAWRTFSELEFFNRLTRIRTRFSMSCCGGSFCGSCHFARESTFSRILKIGHSNKQMQTVGWGGIKLDPPCKIFTKYVNKNSKKPIFCTTPYYIPSPRNSAKTLDFQTMCIYAFPSNILLKGTLYDIFSEKFWDLLRFSQIRR